MKNYYNRYSNENHVNRYLSSLEPHSRNLLLKIKDIVYKINPDIDEDIQWGSIVFRLNENLCGFKVNKSCVRMIFMDGASFSDPYHALQDYGSKFRSLKFNKQSDIDAEIVTHFVKEAIFASKDKQVLA